MSPWSRHSFQSDLQRRVASTSSSFFFQTYTVPKLYATAHMAVAESPEHFEYTPLLNAAGQLRLLKVGSVKNTSNGQEQIHCELVTCDVGAKPDYVAISYTWGDPTHTNVVFVNGKTVVVRQNCWYVLWQAYANNISDFLWIDAICINQLDNAEKSLQVAMMGSIYRNAKQVNVCLGPHHDDSQLLFDATEKHALFVADKLQRLAKTGALSAMIETLQRQGRIEQRLTSTDDMVDMSMYSQSVRTLLLEEMSTRDKFSSMSRPDLEALTEARYCLTDRPYFTRLWICQEILLGRRVKLMVGGSVIDFEDLLDFESDIVGYCLREKSGPHSRVEFDASQEFLTIVNIRNGWSLSGMGLLELTDVFSRFQCFDVRDRIFGMLGMVDWQGYPPMAPSYTKTAFEVGIDTVSYMCPLLEESRAERDNTSWPIASAIQIASALSLDAENLDVKTRLQLRRSPQDTEMLPVKMNSRKAQTKPYVEVVADFYCELFSFETSQNIDLHACLIDREHRPDGSFSEHVLDIDTRQVADSCLVYDRGSPRVRVSNAARAGDMLLSFRDNGTEIGLVVRAEREGSETYAIVGQAVFHEAAVPCPGGARCSCGFQHMPHQQLSATMKVYFDPEDLLLFACQDLYQTVGEDPENTKDLRRFEAIHAGEMIQIAELEELRFVTSVVAHGKHMSSHVEMVQNAEKTTETEGHREMGERLRALEKHLNSWKLEHEC